MPCAASSVATSIGKPDNAPPIGEPQTENKVPRCATIVDHCVEVHSTATSIDERRSRDAQRIDIAAGQRRPIAEHGVPDNVPGISIQPIDEIAFGCCNDKGSSGISWSPKQLSLDITARPRLSVDVTWVTNALRYYGVPRPALAAFRIWVEIGQLVGTVALAYVAHVRPLSFARYWFLNHLAL